jgi:hypothetical protein
MATIEVDGGTPPYNMTATNMPPGLVMDGNGNISGVPSAQGTFQASFAVVDSSQAVRRGR